jgi:hypothetical protein
MVMGMLNDVLDDNSLSSMVQELQSDLAGQD